MNYTELLKLLIEIPSIAPNETAVLETVVTELKKLKFHVIEQAVTPARYNLFVPFGKPQIVFTTHLDVVPAKAEQFQAKVHDNIFYGRGACDAKGIVVAMIETATRLLEAKATNFALLFVIGEEIDGIGAKTAVDLLKEYDLRYLINGEPTENKLATYHRGAIAFEAKFEGKACHSGYPELGIDANKKLINTANRLMAANFGSHPVMGNASINLGQINGGSALNIVSPAASIRGGLRTVTKNEAVATQLKELCNEASNLDIFYNMDPVELFTVPGFETIVANYCSDVPHFKQLGIPCLMYGPGSIHQAHTDNEFVELTDLEQAIADYMKLYYSLTQLINV